MRAHFYGEALVADETGGGVPRVGAVAWVRHPRGIAATGGRRGIATHAPGRAATAHGDADVEIGLDGFGACVADQADQCVAGTAHPVAVEEVDKRWHCERR